MRATLYVLLFTLVLLDPARANSVVLIEIETADAGIRSSINRQPMTAAEIERWMREAISAFGDADPILIRPDERTSFKAVLEILRRCKAAGVKRFEIVSEVEAGGAAGLQSALSVAADHIDLAR